MKQLSFYPKGRHFTQYEAFIDFCLSAEDGIVKFGYGTFGEQWNWTRQAVAGFIKKLQSEKLIKLGKDKKAMEATLTAVCLSKFSGAPSSRKKPPAANAVGQDHQKLIDTYSEWYDKQFGFKPMIDGGDANAARTALKFLKSNTKDDREITESWQVILGKYDQWEAFYRKQTKLKQIVSNLQNIIYSIKHGSSKTKSSGKDLESEIERQVRN
ncbi:MAG: hypothetical protein JKY23_06530 [Nitrospinaceae bacterium]|nr:hypothetical protein [Nitrospinaceae bacterium]